MISAEEYFKYAIKKELMTSLKFFFSVMTIPLQNNNDYYKIENNKYKVLMDGKYEEVSDRTTKEPLFIFNQPILLFNADMSCIPTKVETTIGRAIANYVLFQYPFNGKIEYMEKQFSVKDIEKVVLNNLKSDKITVDEYLMFVNSCSMLESLSRIVTVSATAKTMTPPPGITKFKNDLMAEYDKKYGKNWVKDGVKVIEFQNALKAKDAEYLADDPTNGILSDGGIKDNARAKMYLAFGTDAGFAEDGKTDTVVFNSLLDGYPEDKKQLTMIYNSIRAGSFARGNETQQSGLIAKIFLRSTSNVTIEGDDCKTNNAREILVSKDVAPFLKGRYMVQGSKAVVIDKPESLIGKKIFVRSPLYCEQKNGSICKVCAGEALADYRKGATAIITDLTNILMNSKLKKMHTSVKHLIKSDPISMLR